MYNPFDLKGKRVLVTGASGGLGAHFAHCLASAGAAVVLAARRADRLAILNDELATSGHNATMVALDVQSSESVIDAIAAAPPFDILVNNAGIAVAKPALDMTTEEWDQVVDTNLRGAWLVARTAARRWIAESRAGCVINVASILGERTMGNMAAYNASKAGLLHLTRSLALEWARHDIRVNAICPGYIATEMTDSYWSTESGRRLIQRIPQRRLGNPEDLDGPLILLASGASRFMTGSAITVGGGHLASAI